MLLRLHPRRIHSGYPGSHFLAHRLITNERLLYKAPKDGNC